MHQWEQAQAQAGENPGRSGAGLIASVGLVAPVRDAQAGAGWTLSIGTAGASVRAGRTWRVLHRRRARGVAACLAALLGCGIEPYVHAQEAGSPSVDDYQLGSGLQVPGTGLTLGGYGSASADVLDHQEPRLALDHLSLFVWWQGQGRWKFLSELDAENLVSNRSFEPEGSDHYVALERMYFDYAATDNDTVRIGKFLTPVGRWNVVHAAPLVWTTSRPLVTTLAFPANLTGIMALGNGSVFGQRLDYAAYGSTSQDLRANPDTDAFHAAFGSRTALSVSSHTAVGLSLASFSQASDPQERKQLIGVDFSWERGGQELTGEAIYRFTDRAVNWDQQGGYLQWVVPASGAWSVVTRVEGFRSAVLPRTTELALLGVNYHVSPVVVLKAEWVAARHNLEQAPTGLLTSISVLF